MTPLFKIIDSIGIAGCEGLGQAAVDAEPADGGHLLQTLAQRRGRVRVVLIKLPSKAFALRKALFGVGG
jgi:hypothetical protein